MMSASNIPNYLLFSFSPSVLILNWFGSFIPSVICLYPLFIMCVKHFPCQIPFLYPNFIFLLFVLDSSILFHFLAKCLRSFMYISWLLFIIIIIIITIIIIIIIILSFQILLVPPKLFLSLLCYVMLPVCLWWQSIHPSQSPALTKHWQLFAFASYHSQQVSSRNYFYRWIPHIGFCLLLRFESINIINKTSYSVIIII